MVMALVLTVPIAAFECSSQPPPPERCDDRLNPPRWPSKVRCNLRQLSCLGCVETSLFCLPTPLPSSLFYVSMITFKAPVSAARENMS
jgi:hypothetical protein